MHITLPEPVVLIVNSDKASREWIESTVASAGLRALSFETAAQLLARFNPEVTACAILDVVLEDSSGLELQDRLARSHRKQSGELQSRYSLLSPRERQVFALVSGGLPNKQIAHRLEICDITVQIHRSRVMKKIAASSLASLVRMADTLNGRSGVAQCPGDRAEPR